MRQLWTTIRAVLPLFSLDADSPVGHTPVMSGFDHNGVMAAYDAVVDEYVQAFFDELSRKPFDRRLLEVLAARLAGRGLVCDVGCGPGHVGRYLADRGVAIFGLDLSPAMVSAGAIVKSCG